MKHNMKYRLGYPVLLALFALLYYVVVQGGNQLFEMTTDSVVDRSTGDVTGQIQGIFAQIFSSHVTLLLLQLIVIMLTARMVGGLFVRLGQPRVVGEIVAGILLGPSLFGALSPDAFRFLFAPESLKGIDTLSQIGLILFMFVVGMELDLSVLKKRFGQTMIISHAGIIIPFLFAGLLGYVLFRFYPGREDVSFFVFALFIGIAMSITAFPVLARILQERGMIKSPLGVLAIASAANNDLTAWCILAVTIALATAGNLLGAIITISLSVLYVVFMFGAVYPLMKRLGDVYCKKEVIDKTFMAFIFALLVISSAMTQIIGIHSLFGAFTAGVVMSPNLQFRKIMTEKVEDLTLVVLLPLFFILTGLRTEIGLLNTPDHWIMFGVVTLVAVVSKVFGTAFAARFTGESWYTSMGLGILMNTRGLMELVVLNIGYDLGILSPEAFTTFVLMAIATTLMTAPLLKVNEYIAQRNRRKKERTEVSADDKPILVSVSFGLPDTGLRLIRLIQLIYGSATRNVAVDALHFTRGTDLNPLLSEGYKQEGFEQVESYAKRAKIQLRPVYKMTNNISEEIIEEVNNRPTSLLLTGSSLSMEEVLNNADLTPNNEKQKKGRLGMIQRGMQMISPNDLFVDKTKPLLERVNADVGVLIYRDWKQLSRVAFLLFSPSDRFLFGYAQSTVTHSPDLYARFIYCDEGRYTKDNTEEWIPQYKERIEEISTSALSPGILNRCDLLFVSYEGWERLCKLHASLLPELPAVLILRKIES